MCNVLTTQDIIELSHAQNNFKKQAINIIPTPPKIRTTIIDWEKRISSIIPDILDTIDDHKKQTKTLLVHQIENTSNHDLDTEKIVPILIKMLNLTKNNYITIKSYTSYIKIYENLKSSNKNLTVRSISIKLARYINADYVLYSVIQKKSDNINFKIQLILVQNGEIICSNVIPIL